MMQEASDAGVHNAVVLLHCFVLDERGMALMAQMDPAHLRMFLGGLRNVVHDSPSQATVRTALYISPSPSLCPEVLSRAAVCGSNTSPPRDSPHEPRANPPGGLSSALNRGLPIELPIETLFRVHTRTVQGVQRATPVLSPNKTRIRWHGVV